MDDERVSSVSKLSTHFVVYHVVLRCKSKPEMLKFYVEVLNCPIERETSVGITQLRAGSCLIDLVDVDSEIGKLGGEPPKPNSGHNLDHVCLMLENISEEELKNLLIKADIEVGEFVTRYGSTGNGKSLYIKDPENNSIELKISE